MAIKKKSKVSAEFNMSSLTDIIFLLLIFFMLTSSMVTPNALNLQLPGKKRSTSISKTAPATVYIKSNRTMYWNGTKMRTSEIERKIIAIKRQRKNKALVTVKADAKANNVDLVRILDMLYRHGVKTALTDPVK